MKIQKDIISKIEINPFWNPSEDNQEYKYQCLWNGKLFYGDSYSHICSAVTGKEYVSIRVNIDTDWIVAWGRGETEQEAKKNANSVKVDIDTKNLKTITKTWEEWEKDRRPFYPYKGQLM